MSPPPPPGIKQENVIYCTVYAKNSECPACCVKLDTLPFDSKYTLNCDHEVCYHCWTHWYQAKIHQVVPCPLCREDQCQVIPSVLIAEVIEISSDSEEESDSEDSLYVEKLDI